MTDEDKALVERLRGDLPDKKVESHWVTDYTAIEMQNREAADRIKAQAAEIEKLREALQDMVDMRELHLGSCVHPKGELQIVANARAALGETK